MDFQNVHLQPFLSLHSLLGAVHGTIEDEKCPTIDPRSGGNDLIDAVDKMPGDIG